MFLSPTYWGYVLGNGASAIPAIASVLNSRNDFKNRDANAELQNIPKLAAVGAGLGLAGIGAKALYKKLKKRKRKQDRDGENFSATGKFLAGAGLGVGTNAGIAKLVDMYYDSKPTMDPNVGLASVLGGAGTVLLAKKIFDISKKNKNKKEKDQ